jgi:preprotein translocase subunit SecD
VREADQLIAGALRDIAAEAGLPRSVADTAWRAGRRRRLATLAASAASVAGAIAVALTVVLPLAAAPGPAGPSGPSVQLVSITLSPVTPARTDVLAAAASILRQRAAQLRLPSIQAQVSGANVVLTGPAADETQLKTLAQAGVANLRQVLLYQPAAGAPTYGDTSLVNHGTRALFGKLACTPANASTWKGQVGYNVAGAYDNPDAQIVSCDSSGGKYALDVAKVQDAQISNATAELPTTSNQQEVMLTLNRAGAAAFGTLTSHLFSTYNSGPGAGNGNDLWLDAVALVLDGNMVSAPHIQGPIRDGRFSITDNFTREQAEELAAQLRSGPLPGDFRISAIRTSG